MCPRFSVVIRPLIHKLLMMETTGNMRLYDFGPREMREIESVGYYRWPFNSSRTNLGGGREMRVSKRAIVLIFGLFILPAILLLIPLYLKYRVFATVQYIVNEGDSVEITKGVSSIFCEAHSLQLEGNVLNAYQIDNHEKKTRGKYLEVNENYSTETKGILRSWRYFLRKGYIVKLKLCSSSEDSRIMIVQDSLTTCDPLDNVEKLRLRSGDHSGNNETTNVFLPKNSSVTEHPATRSSTILTITFRDEFAKEKPQTLRLCSDGEMLLDRPILKSPDCFHVQTEIDYEVTEDNYYSFNVYSLTHSTIDFSLDVSKPIFKHSHYWEACLNGSHCVFPLSFMSRQKVIAEIRMQHGDVKDSPFDRSKFVLQSTCEPRKTVYVVFFTLQILTVLLFSFV